MRYAGRFQQACQVHLDLHLQASRAVGLAVGRRQLRLRFEFDRLALGDRRRGEVIGLDVGRVLPGVDPQTRGRRRSRAARRVGDQGHLVGAGFGCFAAAVERGARSRAFDLGAEVAEIDVGPVELWQGDDRRRAEGNRVAFVSAQFRYEGVGGRSSWDEGKLCRRAEFWFQRVDRHVEGPVVVIRIDAFVEGLPPTRRRGDNQVDVDPPHRAARWADVEDHLFHRRAQLRCRQGVSDEAARDIDDDVLDVVGRPDCFRHVTVPIEAEGREALVWVAAGLGVGVAGFVGDLGFEGVLEDAEGETRARFEGVGGIVACRSEGAAAGDGCGRDAGVGGVFAQLGGYRKRGIGATWGQDIFAAAGGFCASATRGGLGAAFPAAALGHVDEGFFAGWQLQLEGDRAGGLVSETDFKAGPVRLLVGKRRARPTLAAP